MLRERALLNYERTSDHRYQSKGSVQSTHIHARTSSIPGFQSQDTNFIRKILLPQLDKYPLSELSHTTSDFNRLANIYPDLYNQFCILDALQDYCLSHHEMLKWRSICVSSTRDGVYLHLELSCKKDDLPVVNQTLDYILA